jgi:cytochrome c
LISGTIALGASLALARVHPFGDAGLYATKHAETPIMEHSPIPPEVRAILTVECADCHSMQTRVPFYGRFAPVSWLMERDMIEARKAMNLSQWEAYAPVQQQLFAAKIAQQTRSHEMPPVQYQMIHWNARVKDAEIRTMAGWAHTSSGFSGRESIQQAGEGDPVRGKVLFDKRCVGCHALSRNHQGPQLQGLYGRTSGAVADYAYSTALKKAKIVWNDKSLEQWLTDPDAFLPGNNMDFSVPRPQDRQDLICYLKQISGK